MATQTQIKSKVRECITLAKQLYGFPLKYSDIEITFKSKGMAAASAWWKERFGHRQYGMKFSTESASLDSNEMLNDTVPHEVAHLVCMYDKSLGNNHDYGWQRVCIALGGTGARTHSQVLTKARYKSQYLYRMSCGGETKVGPKVHKNIQQRGGSYTNRKSGGKFAKDDFIRHITPEEHSREHQKEVAAYRAGSLQAAPTSHKRPAPKKPASQKRPTGASKVGSKKERAMVIYKAFSTNSKETIIAMFMRELDMTKAGATTYYYNCTKG